MAENNPKQKRRTPSWCAQLPNRLGRRMTEYCLRKGWSLYVLSAASGVPLTTIAHIADGSTKNPGIYTIMRICRALDVPLAVFLDGLEEECRNKKEKQGGEILSSPEGSDFSFGKTRRILWVTSMMRRY